MKHFFAHFRGWQLAVVIFLTLTGSLARAQAPVWQTVVAANQTAPDFSSVTATAVNANGDVFIAGYFTGTVSFGSTRLMSAGLRDAFVAKWSPSSNSFLWAQRAGGSDGDEVTGIAVNGTSVYITGFFISPTANFGNRTLTMAGIADVFVAKLTDAGASGAFTWAERAGGPTNEYAAGIAVSGSSVYLVGQYSDAFTWGQNTLSSIGLGDVFVAKLTDAGASANFVWAQRAGGTGFDVAIAVAVSGSNVYITGNTQSQTAAFGSATVSTRGRLDAFVAKLTDAGTTASFVWAQGGGGVENDRVFAIAASGTNVYVTGTFEGASATFGSNVLTNAGSSTTSDVFIAQLTDAGSSGAFSWAQRAGSTGADFARGLTANGTGVYATGGFSGVASFGSGSLTSAGVDDIYVAKLNTAGNFMWTQRAGGAGYESGNAIVVTGAGRVYVGGDFDPPATFSSQTIPGPVGTYVGFLAALTDPTFTASASALAGAAFTIAPNPAHSRVTVQLAAIPGATTATLTVLDAVGHTVRTQTAPATSKSELVLVGLAPGIYAVQVTAGTATATRRLVVE